MVIIEDLKVISLLTDWELSNYKQSQIINLILDKCFQQYPNLKLEVKYGGIILILNKIQIAGLFVYKEHVSIEFSKGYLLEDPKGLLLGNGKYRRHIKIIHANEIENSNFLFYIKQLATNKL